MAMNDSLQSKQITEPDLCAAYGAVVRAGRNALGMSQNGLAAILGVHRTTLVRLEQGTPPLRRGLCMSAVEVLKKAGVVCETSVIQKGSGKLNDTNLLLSITAEAVRRAQQGIDGLIPSDGLTTHFLGDGFVPPLEENPLRKK